MQPLGRKAKLHNFVDCHPPKGTINWWDHIGSFGQKAERQQAKRTAKLQVEEYIIRLDR